MECRNCMFWAMGIGTCFGPMNCFMTINGLFRVSFLSVTLALAASDFGDISNFPRLL